MRSAQDSPFINCSLQPIVYNMCVENNVHEDFHLVGSPCGL